MSLPPHSGCPKGRSKYLVPGLLALVAHGGLFLLPGGSPAPDTEHKVLRASAMDEPSFAIQLSTAEDSSGGVSQAASPPPAARVPAEVILKELLSERPSLSSTLPLRVELGAEGVDCAAAAAIALGTGSAGGHLASLRASRLPQNGAKRAGAVEPTYSPLPPYPEGARIERRSGVVELLVRLDPQGKPRSVTVARSSGSLDLDAAARDVVNRSWRFPRPNPETGVEPVSVAVRFNLQGHSTRIALMAR